MDLIRAATLQDLPGTYRVCLLTGDAGLDATALFHNPDLLGHGYVGAYLVGQPDLALVVADSEGVAGYCLAASDTRAFEAWAETAWWPALREQYPLRGDTSADAGSDTSADAEIIRLFHAPPRALDAVVDEYPAHLHLDLLARARGHGNGRALIERQLANLRRRGARGVHLDVATDNANAIEFYRHLGFAEIGRLESSIVMGMRSSSRSGQTP